MEEQLSLSTLLQLMADHGCRQVLAKNLSENDNSKNQVYFGSSFDSLNLLPVKEIRAETGKLQFKASLDFFWLDAHGQISQAPGAQLILYPQYPEVRFSGFLKGSRYKPSSLMASRHPGRLLFMGIRNDGSILGYVVPADSDVAKELRARDNLKETRGVFIEVPLDLTAGVDSSKKTLITRLHEIHKMGWVSAIRLNNNGSKVECHGSNCGGYTLEALLGITPNSNSEPDYLGWEIKQHGVRNFNALGAGVITLMTPEPHGGYYKNEGLIPFVLKYGYMDQKGRADRLNFGGIHIADTQTKLTGLKLTLSGYNKESEKIVDNQGGIDLVDKVGGLAARWYFADLMSHWNRKHSLAAYVPSKLSHEPHQSYAFGPFVRFGEGTDFLRFLKAVSLGIVYYDPGIKVENISSDKPKTKRRSQFRIKSKDIGALYNKFSKEDVTKY